MNWGFISVILAPIFFVAMVVLAINLTRKKKPVWAYKTARIIGLGTDAPAELKMIFNGKPINDVYRTIFIFFNKGKETIRKTDVTEDTAIHFKGADILRQPILLATSKEANKFSASQSVKHGDNAIMLDFLYLDYNDGAVVEVLHTKSQDITCSGNIMGTNRIHYIGEFPLTRSGKLFIWPSINVGIIAGASGLVLASLLEGELKLVTGRDYLLIILILVALGAVIGTWISTFLKYMIKFPKWSILKK